MMPRLAFLRVRGLAPVQLVNRALWALLGLTLLAAAATLGWQQLRLRAPVEPLPVPRVALAPLPKDGVLAAPAQRNPFDPSGTPWRLAEATPAAVQSSQVLGIIILPQRRGVMTPSGFVAVGEDFGGGKLKQVSRDLVVVAHGAEERKIEIGGGKEIELLRKLGLDGRPARKGAPQ